jgi:hypothetical protein
MLNPCSTSWPASSLDSSRTALAILERHQYCYAPYRTGLMHWLCKPSPAQRTHHLHVVPLRARSGTSSWRFAITYELIPMCLWNTRH